jgi:hypothetical protein
MMEPWAMSAMRLTLAIGLLMADRALSGIAEAQIGSRYFIGPLFVNDANQATNST